MYKGNLNEIWQRTLEILENELNRPSFNTWLKSTRLVMSQDETIYVEVPNQFSKNWLESRYYNLIKNTLQLILGDQQIKLRFVLPQEKNLQSPGKGRANLEQASPEDNSYGFLNPRYTFDTFVVGNSNRFAHAASLAVSEAPARAYNPLFIYGGVGLGKTHLMHAIGHHVTTRFSHHRVCYVSSEKFTNEMINSIRDDKTEEFRAKYRNIDVLLVDDIQFLAGKERTQEEFFHTFNTLHEANKQIILSSDRAPKEIPTLEDRLRSRFEWGLITDIQTPDLETRIAILKKKATLESLNLPNDVLLYIANKIQTNIRELEGALIRVAAFASFTDKRIDAEMAAEALKDLSAAQQPITILLIQEKVAEHYNLKIEEFKARKRTRSVAFPRQVAMYLARELTDASLPKIGDEFGGRDHTTVIHAHEKIANELKSNQELVKAIRDLMTKIAGE